MEFEYCPVCGTKSLFSVRNLDWKHQCNRCLNVFAILDVAGRQGIIIKNDPITDDPIFDFLQGVLDANGRSDKGVSL